MLSKKFRDALRKKVDIVKQQLTEYEPATPLYDLEARYSLFCLEKILATKKRLSTDILVTFLKERWQIVQSTDIQYLHDLSNPVNKICIKIALKLGKILDEPYLTLLMPSLSVISCNDYLVSSYADDHDLREIVLSDDNQRLISIPDVLDGAQVDGVLKHNSLFRGKVRKLSAKEEKKVLSRHQSVREYYDALHATVIFKQFGDTVGSALNRLIIGLRQGGEHEWGYKNDSGEDANVAIVDFGAYLNALDSDTKKVLMKACMYNKYNFADGSFSALSVRSLWKDLARSKTKKYDEGATYCVEMIANDLEEILAGNPELYDLMSTEGDAPIKLSLLQAAITQTKEAMISALPTIKMQRFYGVKGDNKLCSKLLHKIEELFDLSDDLPGFLLTKDDIVYFAESRAFACKQGNTEQARVFGELLHYICSNYDSREVIRALRKMTAESARQFVQLTGFVEPAARMKQSFELPFFRESARHKRKSAEAELGVLFAKGKRFFKGKQDDEDEMAEVGRAFPY